MNVLFKLYENLSLCQGLCVHCELWEWVTEDEVASRGWSLEIWFEFDDESWRTKGNQIRGWHYAQHEWQDIWSSLRQCKSLGSLRRLLLPIKIQNPKKRHQEMIRSKKLKINKLKDDQSQNTYWTEHFLDKVNLNNANRHHKDDLNDLIAEIFWNWLDEGLGISVINHLRLS